MLSTKSITTLLLGFVALCAQSQSKATATTKPIASNTQTKAGTVTKSLNFEYALNDPFKARIYTLKNGLKVYMTVYKNAPRIQLTE